MSIIQPERWELNRGKGDRYIDIEIYRYRIREAIRNHGRLPCRYFISIHHSHGIWHEDESRSTLPDNMKGGQRRTAENHNRTSERAEKV